MTPKRPEYETRVFDGFTYRRHTKDRPEALRGTILKERYETEEVNKCPKTGKTKGSQNNEKR